MPRSPRDPALAALSGSLAQALARQRDLGVRGLPEALQRRILACLDVQGVALAPRSGVGVAPAAQVAPFAPAAPAVASAGLQPVAPVAPAPKAVRAPRARTAAASSAGSTPAAASPTARTPEARAAAALKPWAEEGRRPRRRRSAPQPAVSTAGGGAAPAVTAPASTSASASTSTSTSGAAPAAPAVAAPAKARVPADSASMPDGALAQEVAACEACDRCGERRTAVCGVGASPARILFVCEQPEEAADAAGSLRVGEAWELFRSLTSRLGLGQAQVYLTPALKCRSTHRMTRAQAQACRGWLRREWDLCDPQAVVLFGGAAAAVLSGSDQLRQARCGQTLVVRDRPALVVDTLEAMLEEPARRRDTWNALQKLLHELPAYDKAS